MKDMCIRKHNIESYDAEYLNETNAKVMSEVKIVKSLNLNNLAEIDSILNNGGVKENESMHCLVDGVIHAIAVWFTLYLTDDIIVNTSPFDKDNLDCWEQAIFYLDHPVTVHKGMLTKNLMLLLIFVAMLS